MSQLFFILIILSGIFALIQIFKIDDKFARVINGIFAVAIGVSFIPIPEIAIDGYYLFAIGCLVVVLYPFSDNSLNVKKQVIIAGMGFIQFMTMIFFLGKYPGTEMAFMASGITIIAYFYVVSKEIRLYKNEIGFLTVLMVDALIKVGTIVLSYTNTEAEATALLF